jgi:hypothetical protein
MTGPGSADPTPVNDALRRLHRSAIASLALCAAGIGITAFMGPEPDPGRELGRAYSWSALALAAVAILARRTGTSAVRSVRRYVYGALVSMVAAAGLGMLGMLVALRESQSSTGLLYVLAGALLVLRPPAPLARSTPGET